LLVVSKTLPTILDEFPEYATALGRLIGQWGMLERHFISVLGYLLGTDQARAQMVFNTFPALMQKLQLIERLTKCVVEPSNARECLLEYIGRAKKLNDTRNMYVHATWGVRGQGPGELTCLQSSLPQNTEKRFKEPKSIKLSDIQRDVDDAAMLSYDMFVFCLEKEKCAGLIPQLSFGDDVMPPEQG
jgi:hypothetical protein